MDKKYRAGQSQDWVKLDQHTHYMYRESPSCTSCKAVLQDPPGIPYQVEVKHSVSHKVF